MPPAPSSRPAPRLLRRLEQAARSAAKSAYAPYSGFPVGAAVLGASGRVYSGCNVENASYGLSNCAERTAIFSAVAAGERRIRAVAVYTPTDSPTAPCGACRQVIREFGPDAPVACLGLKGRRLDIEASALLPHGFDGKSLPGRRR